ncbi:SDR family oxidoreductase [Caldisphaera lagunensis]|nr:SDR family oxidoreductase [Caldisphaera lagunensis]
MKLLITGITSLPGYKTVIEGIEKNHEIVGIYHEKIPDLKIKLIKADLTNKMLTQDIIIKEKPDAIIHIAGMGDVDNCEVEKEKCFNSNYLSTLNIVKVSNAFNIHMIYLSTDYVFDGQKGNYKENETPNPINYYGLTKLLGESSVKTLTNYAIVRTSTIYGIGIGRSNFAMYLINKLKNGEEIKAVVDQFTSPTNTTLLAKALIEIAEKRLIGVFHVGGERLSRYEFAVKLAEKMGFDTDLIRKTYINEMKWKAKRPIDSSLNFDNTKKFIDINFYETENALNILKSEYYSLKVEKDN